MRAMMIEKPGPGLRLVERATPEPGAGQILVAVADVEVGATAPQAVVSAPIKRR